MFFFFNKKDKLRVEELEKRVMKLEGLLDAAMNQAKFDQDCIEEKMVSIREQAARLKIGMDERALRMEEELFRQGGRVTSLNTFMSTLEVSVNERFAGFFVILERHIKALLGQDTKMDLVNSLLKKIAKLEKGPEKPNE